MFRFLEHRPPIVFIQSRLAAGVGCAAPRLFGSPHPLYLFGARRLFLHTGLRYKVGAVTPDPWTRPVTFHTLSTVFSTVAQKNVLKISQNGLVFFWEERSI